jgi:hypothetical protein
MAQTRGIFQLNIERLKEVEKQKEAAIGEPAMHIFEGQILDFAKRHFDEHAANDGFGRWNGRQIRNAFLVAASLARFEVLGEDGAQAQLRGDHFDKVAQMVSEYDLARAGALNYVSDSQRALQRDERCDNLDLARTRLSIISNSNNNSSQQQQGSSLRPSPPSPDPGKVSYRSQHQSTRLLPHGLTQVALNPRYDLHPTMDGLAESH